MTHKIQIDFESLLISLKALDQRTYALQAELCCKTEQKQQMKLIEDILETRKIKQRLMREMEVYTNGIQTKRA